MGVFTYANPPVIRWGAGSVAQLPGEVARLCGTRVALVTTSSLTGLTDRIACTPVATVVIGQHAPLAQIDQATAGVDAAKADLVLSFGGGSPIDAAKIVARDVADRRRQERSLPHVAVPTTLSVAELASGAGFTDAAGAKAGRRDPRMLPDSVIYDGELALATPMPLWLSTGIRALDHAVESFLAPGEHPFSDVLALEAVRRLFRTLPLAKAHPGDPAIRTENQLAAWFSYTLTGPTAAGLSHVMGKQIGARHGIPHGVTSCLLMPHVMRYQGRRHPEKLAELGRATGGPETAADDVAALIADLGLPRHIADYGIGEAELRTAAEELAGEHPAADLLAIYLAAL